MNSESTNPLPQIRNKRLREEEADESEQAVNESSSIQPIRGEILIETNGQVPTVFFDATRFPGARINYKVTAPTAQATANDSHPAKKIKWRCRFEGTRKVTKAANAPSSSSGSLFGDSKKQQSLQTAAPGPLSRDSAEQRQLRERITRETDPQLRELLGTFLRLVRLPEELRTMVCENIVANWTSTTVFLGFNDIWNDLQVGILDGRHPTLVLQETILARILMDANQVGTKLAVTFADVLYRRLSHVALPVHSFRSFVKQCPLSTLATPATRMEKLSLFTTQADNTEYKRLAVDEYLLPQGWELPITFLPMYRRTELRDALILAGKMPNLQSTNRITLYGITRRANNLTAPINPVGIDWLKAYLPLRHLWERDYFRGYVQIHVRGPLTRGIPTNTLTNNPLLFVRDELFYAGRNALRVIDPTLRDTMFREALILKQHILMSAVKFVGPPEGEHDEDDAEMLNGRGRWNRLAYFSLALFGLPAKKGELVGHVMERPWCLEITGNW